MNWFKKGPELKLSSLKPSELKVPPFLSDLYWDLRDRRLLPLVALAIVAIVAVPFLLGGGSKSSSPPTLGIAPPTAEPLGSGSASLTVVEAKPGLRDYRKRLAGRRPTDPFKQRYTGSMLKGAKLNGATTSTTTTTTTESSTGGGSGGAPSGSTGTTPVAPPSTGGGGQPGHLTFFTFAVDVKVTLVPGEASGSSAAISTPTPTPTASAGSGSSQPTVMHGVKPATPLPGKKAPVVTYMGSIDKAKIALFMVSPEVTSVFGDAQCLSGTNSCQLLGVEAGVPEVFAYGFDHNRLKIEVLKIKPVVTGHS